MRRLQTDKDLFQSVMKVIFLFALLYFFLISISLMGAGLKREGKEFIENFIAGSNSAFIGLFIGILATSIIQSSSTTTSIVVGLVGGGLFSLEQAIPIVMGANIGTSITNLLVSFGHIKSKVEFKRAFSAALVHDVFNFLTVLIFFPLQLKFNLLGRSALILSSIFENAGGLKFISPLKLVVTPVVKIIDHGMPNGWVSVAIALTILFLSLNYIVVVMKSLVLNRLSVFFDRIVFRTPLIGLFFGMVFTAIVQSSSVTTSLIIPLAGAGVVNLKQVFPYTLGANIGTTITALLAFLVTVNTVAVAVAFAHLMFNVYGILIFLPLSNIPITIATKVAEWSIRNRFIPVIIVLMVFLVIPMSLILIVR